MDIRKLWLTLVQRADPQRGVDRERIRVIGRVLIHLRNKEKSLLDLKDATTDDEQRADLANRLSVLRAQRAKGLRALRELRAGRRAGTRGQASGMEVAGPREVSVDSASPERKY
jgi:hypothetical protein